MHQTGPKGSEEEQNLMKKITDLQQKLDFSQNFRRTEKWFPERLLCRRFDVPQPHPDKDYYNKRMQSYQEGQTKQAKTVKFRIERNPEPKIESDDPSYYGLPTEFQSNRDTHA